MLFAARWLGVGSIVIGTLASVLLAVSLYPGPPEQLTEVGTCDCWNTQGWSHRFELTEAEGFQALAK